MDVGRHVGISESNDEKSSPWILSSWKGTTVWEKLAVWLAGDQAELWLDGVERLAYKLKRTI
ncbi:MAG: hypothetical protein DI617_09515 [Streptococcus pyogenes]|nr:MAG: hypothetical protein DI617_09515 [Streptococcus pyogenes]